MSKGIFRFDSAVTISDQDLHEISPITLPEGGFVPGDYSMSISSISCTQLQPWLKSSLEIEIYKNAMLRAPLGVDEDEQRALGFFCLDEPDAGWHQAEYVETHKLDSIELPALRDLMTTFSATVLTFGPRACQRLLLECARDQTPLGLWLMPHFNHAVELGGLVRITKVLDHIP